MSSLAEGLVRKGHEVIVLTSNSNLDEDLDVPTDCPVDVDGVQVWYFKRREPLKRLFSRVAYVSKSLGFLYSPKMAKALDRLVPGVDVVHTHLPFVYPTYAAAHAAFRHGKSLFYHQRGGFDPERLKFRSLKKMLYLRMIEISILKRATTLIALTGAEAANYERLGVSTPCRVIPNGIDIAPYSVSRDQALLETIGIGQQHAVVLFLGRIHPIKGADRLLDAFLQVKQEFPEAMLVFAGPDEFGLEASLRRRADVAGFSRSVIFPGMVQGALKKQLLARADLFCLPSAAEGFSMAVLEALASSTAVLLSPGCHFPEVERNGAGRIVEADPGILAVALRELLSDRNELARMGQAGRQLVAESYTWESATTQLVEAYEEGISRHAISLRGR